MGHARALLAFSSPHAQSGACKKIIAEGLSVRQTERLAASPRPKPRTKPQTGSKDPNIAALEDELRRRLGTRVALRPQGNGKGKIEIEYYSLDELDRLLAVLRSTR
jgi:ParB family chromosome partitioning protein